jgi:hypothetical protein
VACDERKRLKLDEQLKRAEEKQKKKQEKLDKELIQESKLRQRIERLKEEKSNANQPKSSRKAKDKALTLLNAPL